MANQGRDRSRDRSRPCSRSCCREQRLRLHGLGITSARFTRAGSSKSCRSRSCRFDGNRRTFSFRSLQSLPSLRTFRYSPNCRPCPAPSLPILANGTKRTNAIAARGICTGLGSRAMPRKSSADNEIEVPTEQCPRSYHVPAQVPVVMSPRRRHHLSSHTILAVIFVAGFCVSAVVSASERGVPAPLPARAAGHSPFAVGGTARKALPPLDCLQCPGPAPLAPCAPHHPGFLFYGTYPWDDDCMNGFRHCPHGDCGHAAATLSRAWMHLHEKGRRTFHRAHANGRLPWVPR